MDSVAKMVETTDYKTYLRKNASKRILIYGAGIVAYYFSYNLMQNENFQKAFSGFAVKDPQYDVMSYWGIPVKGIAEYEHSKNEYCLIVATKETVWNEIKCYLEEHKWCNYYFLSQEEYGEIRDQYPRIIEEEYYIRQFEKIRTTFGILKNGVHYMNRTISNIVDDYKYQSCPVYEKKYSDEFKKYRCRDNYMQEVHELLSGLPVESIQEVSRILDRLNRLCDNRPIIYSLEEQEKVKAVKNNFRANIHKITESWYMYKDYRLPVNCFEECVFWYEHGLGMLENLDKIKDKALIDAGGYIGDSALVFSKYWEGNIYSFEADPDNLKIFEATVRMNSLKNVIPVNKALVDKTEIVDLYKTEAISCSTVEAKKTFAPLSGDLIQMDGTSVDDFVETEGISVGLIKIDVEGAEQRLLKGAKRTIQSQKPDLIISIYHSIEDFFYIKKQIEEMDVGYRFKIFRPVLRESFLLETCLICEAL